MTQKIEKCIEQVRIKLKKEQEVKEKDIFKSIQQTSSEIESMIRESKFSAFSMVDFDNQSLTGIKQETGLPKLLRIGKLYPTNVNSEKKQLFTKPLLLPYTETQAISFILKENDQKEIHVLFSLLAFRLMLSLPQNLCRFYFVDNNFGRDFSLINRIDKKVLGNAVITNQNELNHLISELEQTVIESYQKHLVSYETLEEYNAASPDMQEPYHFVFIANFPAGFSAESAEKLYNLISRGNAAKAGIHIFYSIDTKYKPAFGIDVSRFTDISCRIYQNSPIDYEIENSVFSKKFNDSFNIILDNTLPKNIDEIINLINHKKVEKTQVSFLEHYKQRLQQNDIWKGSAIDNIKIPLGFVNPRKVQYLNFGKQTNDYFGLIGGLPGTGKTVLLHNIILWGALEYSHQELNYYLIDCKNGTGFNAYKKLPHVKILSVSNDREFAASALGSLINEMYHRADLFKKASSEKGKLIENIHTYRKETGKSLPRILTIVDEFQVLFEHEDKISRVIRETLNKLFTEGRAFGISILLCSQGLGRVDVPIKNITWRLSFRLLSNMESEKILGNDGALKLTRIGNAIINNQNGEKSHNINFQVGFIDDVYPLVEKIRDKFEQEFPNEQLNQFISDGNTSGRIDLNVPFRELLKSDDFKVNDRYCDVYLGEPSFIRTEHAYIRIRKQQASNVVMVGNDLRSAITLIGLMNYQIFKQSSQESKFYIIDSFNIDNEFYDRLKFAKGYIPNLEYFSSKQISTIIDEIYSELELRIEKENNREQVAGRVLLSILYMQNCRELKKDGYNISPTTKKLIRIIKEGPEYGIHVICHSLTYQGLQEILDANTLGEFENRLALDSGKSMSIITEQTASRIEYKGAILLQAPDEFTTYNPDLIRVYSKCTLKETNDNIKFINQLIK